MAMPATTIWTADMVRALPDDGNRYEVIDGELFVTPSPVLLHQRAAFALGMLLSGYVKAHAVGDVLLAPDPVNPPLIIDLPAYFRDVTGE